MSVAKRVLAFFLVAIGIAVALNPELRLADWFRSTTTEQPITMPVWR